MLLFVYFFISNVSSKFWVSPHSEEVIGAAKIVSVPIYLGINPDTHQSLEELSSIASYLIVSVLWKFDVGVLVHEKFTISNTERDIK